MNNLRRARFASLVCLTGAAILIIYGLLAVQFGPYTQLAASWDEALWAFANVGMIGGAIGLFATDVGRPRWLAVSGATLSVLGNLIRIVVSALLIVAPSRADSYVPFILISILLMVLGMGALGAATLRGKQLPGWQAWTPLLAGGCALIIAPTYSVNLYLHFILLGLWGVPWLLVGYAVFTYAASQRQAVLGYASSARPEQGTGLTQPH